jgi:hypothetical protein
MSTPSSECDFNGTGGFTCGEPTVIAAYCSGPSGGTTAGSGTPDETVTINGDGTDDKPDGAGGSTRAKIPADLVPMAPT